jgi:hypothetical protein
VLLGDPHGEALAEALRGLGNTVQSDAPATASAPTGVDALGALARDLADRADVPDVVLLLPAAIRNSRAAGSADAIESLIARFTEALDAWVAEERTAAVPLVVVTRDAVATGPDDPVDGLAHAALWGLLRSYQTRFPGRFVLFDLGAGEEGDASGLAAALSVAVASGESQCAVREGVVLRPRLVRAAADVAGAPDTSGTVLVTGSDGVAAEHLTRHLVTLYGARHVVWVGADTGAHTALRAELAATGAEIRAESCDITDRRAAARLLARTTPQVTAIVHTSGRADTQTRPGRRLALQGALNLHELTKDSTLGTFILVTSADGLLGAPGHGPASAVAAALGALTGRRHAQGLPALCLALGPWEAAAPADLDAEAATPAAVAATVATGQAWPVATVSTHDALAMFDAAHTVAEPQLAVVRLDIDALDRGEVPVLLRGLIDVPAGTSATPDALAAQALRGRLEG